ncbi:MAG: tetratricopeptide repeat protein [Saprospiraceae bacterium]
MIISSASVAAQNKDSISHLIQLRLDTVFEKIKTEKDDEKLFELVLNIYYTGIEAYPLLYLDMSQRLYTLAKEKKNKMLEASALSFFGQSYRMSGNYVKGLEYHHKAIALAETVQSKSLLGITQNQMAHIYKDRGEFDKALKLYWSAMSNARQGKTQEIIVWPSINLGAIYLVTN